MNELRKKVIEYNTEVKTALQEVFNGLNQGQRKKLLRNPTIRAMFERYGVETDAKSGK
nr:MAG TPA: Swi5 [Caudoviricetes sp.]